MIILLMVRLYTGSLSAQVLIGENENPKDFSLLEISAEVTKGGLRLPQLTTSNRDSLNKLQDAIKDPESMKGLFIYNVTNESIEYWNGTQWVSYNSSSNNTKWFYMPPFAIDVSQSGTFTINLYSKYEEQFKNIPNLKFYNRNELEYCVTGYDTKTFSNVSITSDGKLEYTADASKVSDATFMNIIAVVK